MTISTHDDIIAALAAGKGQELPFYKDMTTTGAGIAASAWADPDLPPAGGYGTALVMRHCTNVTTGAFAFGNATGDDTLYLIGGGAYCDTANYGFMIAYDRVADISGIDLTTLSVQNITSSTLQRYADGAGLAMFLEITTTVVGTPVFSVTYTDQDGNTGAVTPSVTGAAHLAGRLGYVGGPYIPLAAGDRGVRAVTSFTCSSAGSAGVGCLVLARPLLRIPFVNANTVVERDLITQYPRLPILYDDHCIAFMTYGSGATAGEIGGSLIAVAG